MHYFPCDTSWFRRGYVLEPTHQHGQGGPRTCNRMSPFLSLPTNTFLPLVTIGSQAYAKFFGSYAALETGHVHHALSAFTGAQSEEIFLAGAGRGVGKKSLWKKLTK